MGAPSMTQELMRETLAVLEAHGGNQMAAARSLGISRATFQSRVYRAQNFVAAPPAAVPEMSGRERFDAAFWRKKAADAQKAADEAEHIAEQLAGVRNVSWSIPEWLVDASEGDKGRSVIGCLVSDMHMGEVIDATEMDGVNAFNPEICRERMRRYFEAACIVGKRWAADTQCEGALLALGGDQTSGSIHDELAMTNALTSPEQVIAATEVLAAGIIKLRLAYNRVHVVSVPGNHSRTTHKSTAKLYSRLSYDTMIAAMLAERFRGDKNITFQYGPARDQIVPVFGRTVFLTHGDAIGTGGGQGFAGPMLPIIRGTKKVEAQQARYGRRPDLILHGHFHYSGNAGSVLSNGALPGNSEYGNVIRASPEAPRQWLFLLHSRWWLRERADIMLSDPEPVEKPRVRVPAWS